MRQKDVDIMLTAYEAWIFQAAVKNEAVPPKDLWKLGLKLLNASTGWEKPRAGNPICKRCHGPSYEKDSVLCRDCVEDMMAGET